MQFSVVLKTLHACNLALYRGPSICAVSPRVENVFKRVYEQWRRRLDRFVMIETIKKVDVSAASNGKDAHGWRSRSGINEKVVLDRCIEEYVQIKTLKLV